MGVTFKSGKDRQCAMYGDRRFYLTVYPGLTSSVISIRRYCKGPFQSIVLKNYASGFHNWLWMKS